MNIPTIQDYNDLGCCCPLPECPGKRWQNQSREDDSTHGEFKAWIRPPGADDADDLPVIYTSLATTPGAQIEEGTAILYQGWKKNHTMDGKFAELLQVGTISAIYLGDALVVETYNEATAYPVTTITGTGGRTGVHQFRSLFSLDVPDPFYTSLADSSSLITAAHFTVTDDVYRFDSDLFNWTTTASAPALQGVGGAADLEIYFCDVLVGTYDELVLTGPVTRPEFLAAAIADLALVSFSGGIETGLPEAVTVASWSKVGDFPWPPGDDLDAAFGIATDTPRPGGYAELTGKQYKVGIPSDWETANAAWIAWTALHAAWEAEDPETRGDEPIRGWKRSVFECKWVEAYFPKKWIDYVTAHGTWETAHGTWETEHAEWEALPEEERSDEPEEPPEPPRPEASEDRPQQLETREWTYGGPGSNAFSDWFVLSQPPDNGKSRPVNMMITCYHSEQQGVKPTAHGEQVNFADPQP